MLALHGTSPDYAVMPCGVGATIARGAAEVEIGRTRITVA